jgi:hypothetical protein
MLTLAEALAMKPPGRPCFISKLAIHRGSTDSWYVTLQSCLCFAVCRTFQVAENATTRFGVGRGRGRRATDRGSFRPAG